MFFHGFIPPILYSDFCLPTASAYLRLIANANKPVCAAYSTYRPGYNNTGRTEQSRTAFATIAAMHVGAFCFLFGFLLALQAF